MIELLKALVSLVALTTYTVSAAGVSSVPVLVEKGLLEKVRQIEAEVEIQRKLQQEHPACFLVVPNSKNKEFFESICPFEVEYHWILIPENLSRSE